MPITFLAKFLINAYSGQSSYFHAVLQDNVEALIETVPILIVQKYQPTTVKFGQCMRKLGLQSMSCFCAGSLPLSGSLSLYCFSLQLLFFIVVNKISIYLSIYLLRHGLLLAICVFKTIGLINRSCRLSFMSFIQAYM